MAALNVGTWLFLTATCGVLGQIQSISNPEVSSGVGIDFFKMDGPGWEQCESTEGSGGQQRYLSEGGSYWSTMVLASLGILQVFVGRMAKFTSQEGHQSRAPKSPDRGSFSSGCGFATCQAVSMN